MHVPEIISVKEKLDALREQGLIAEWELPYENLLTRLSAAIFFVAPATDDGADAIWNVLGEQKDFSARVNTEQKLSNLKYRVTFSPEEKKINDESRTALTSVAE